MTEYKVNEDFKIINGSNLDVLDTMPDNSVDAIITDPPYELGFMGKKWDSTGIAYNVELWKKALRVLKHGGYLLAFGGTRTYHRIACAIEDAGFEIRDCIMWLYGSGFPKSMNIGLAIDKLNGVESKVIGNAGYTSPISADLFKVGIQTENRRTDIMLKQARNEWNGRGTQLKPAYEPIIMARKPIEETIAQNCLKWGVGGINIDECRVKTDDNLNGGAYSNNTELMQNQIYGTYKKIEADFEQPQGRFPANLITDGSDEVASGMPHTKSNYEEPNAKHTFKGNKDAFQYGYKMRVCKGTYEDEGSAMRYFYQAKASKKDRDEGLDYLPDGLFRRMRPDKDDNNPTGLNKEGRFAPVIRKNVHPTVKPVELMQYLVRLVAPKGALIVDIFNGSGSTGKAVAFENRERDANYKYIGIELEEEYCKISQARIDYALNIYEYELEKEIEKQHKEMGMSLFDFI